PRRAVTGTTCDPKGGAHACGDEGGARARPMDWQPPLGYTRGERGGPSMTPHPELAPVVRTAFADFAGGMDKADVLRPINANGVAGRRGGGHTFKSLDRLFRNVLYA